MSAVWPYLAAILPTILVAILFYFLIKSMLEGDRRERIAQRRFEAEQDLAQGRARPRSRPTTTDSEAEAPTSTDPGSTPVDPGSAPQS